MSLKPETVFYQRIKPYLEALPYSFVLRMQQEAIRGTPDIIMCVRGRFVALELKKSAKAPVTKLQKYVLEMVRRAGGYGEVCYPENWLFIYSDLLRIANKETADVYSDQKTVSTAPSRPGVQQNHALRRARRHQV
jgi:hypothetical protein